jgi:hypothetical protein
MFEEEPFSSDDEHQTTKTSMHRRAEKRPREGELPARDVVADARPLPTVSVAFHRPGDVQFRSHAGSPGVCSSPLDGVAVGDLWLSKECHCLRCEMLRAQRQLSSRSKTATGPGCVVLLWDLDNFGFRDLQRSEPAAPRGSTPLSSRCLLWGFYGACFTRHYRCRPEDLDVQPESTLGQLRTHGAVMMTPCGGHKEAVDEVLVAAARAAGLLAGSRLTIVVTGDKHLAQFMMETLCDNADATDVGASPLRVIDVNKCDRKIGNVWKTIREMEAALPPLK